MVAASASSLTTFHSARVANELLETTRLKRDVQTFIKEKSIEMRMRQVATPILATSDTGIMRSVLVFDAILPISNHVLAAAKDVADQIVEEHAAATRHRIALQRVDSATQMRAAVCDSAAAPVPLRAAQPCVTPSNVFTIGMFLMETARTAYNSIAAKQSFLAVPLAPEAVPDALEATELRTVNIKQHRPGSVLNISDLQFELQDDDATRRLVDEAATPGTPDCVRRVAVHATATVAGDRAIAVGTLLPLLADAAARTDDATAQRSLLRQWRSVLFAAGIQCSSYHQFSNSVAARETNTKIEGTNKIEAPDNHYLAFPTIHQAFVVGHSTSSGAVQAYALQRHVWCRLRIRRHRIGRVECQECHIGSTERGVRDCRPRTGRSLVQGARFARGGAVPRWHLCQSTDEPPRRAASPAASWSPCGTQRLGSGLQLRRPALRRMIPATTSDAVSKSCPSHR